MGPGDELGKGVLESGVGFEPLVLGRYGFVMDPTAIIKAGRKSNFPTHCCCISGAIPVAVNVGSSVKNLTGTVYGDFIYMVRDVMGPEVSSLGAIVCMV